MLLRTVIWCLCLFTVRSNAQTTKEALSHIPEKAKEINAFVPKGYEVMETARGDLNKDGREDAVMVLNDVREKVELSDSEEYNDRLLVVLLRSEDGWKLALKSETIISCKECGGMMGDPYSGIEIANGVLTISHNGGSAWRWSAVLKFRYQNGDLFLIGKTHDMFWIMGNCGGDIAGKDYEDINLLTGARVRLKISEDCDTLLDKKDKIKVKPLVRMADYKGE